jgi:hypothetical protein
VCAWLIETDFTRRQFDGLCALLIDAWSSKDEQNLTLEYAGSWDRLRLGGQEQHREVWRKERLASLRKRDYHTGRWGLGGQSALYAWAKMLDDSTQRIIVDQPSQLRQQAAEAFVEASVVLSRLMIYGSSGWRPDYSTYQPAIDQLAASWPELDSDSRDLVMGASDWWGAITWDGESMSQWYSRFWLHDIAPDLASRFVPGFASWRPHLTREFWEQVSHVEEVKRAAAERRRAAERVAAEARAATAAAADPGDRAWIKPVMQNSARASNRMIDTYNESARTSFRGSQNYAPGIIPQPPPGVYDWSWNRPKY